MKNRHIAMVLALAGHAFVASWAPAEGPLPLDRYGGLTTIQFEATGFFRTHHDGERWWLVSPDGNAFLSLGVCCISSSHDKERGTNRDYYNESVLKKRGSAEQWKEVTLERLKAWGVNTLGGWSSEELRDVVPYTVVLSMGTGMWRRGAVPDFFSGEFEQHAAAQARSAAAHVNDPFLLGYFLANELPWLPDHRMCPDLFSGYVAMPPDAPGKGRLVRFFRERYADPAAFGQVWDVDLAALAALAEVDSLAARDRKRARTDRDAFVLLAARQYFKVATDAVRAVDPNHLILGCRFIWQTAARSVVEACGEYCDVVSTNCYETGPVARILLAGANSGVTRMPGDRYALTRYGELTGKPLLITEFSFRAHDSGCVNSFPPAIIVGPIAATQRERADKFERFATRWIAQPCFVGYHWFQYMDQPRGGRFDGEDSNFGIVDITDEPHGDFVARLAEVNRKAWGLHQAAK